jgi:hypothetical protein
MAVTDNGTAQQQTNGTPMQIDAPRAEHTGWPGLGAEDVDCAHRDSRLLSHLPPDLDIATARSQKQTNEDGAQSLPTNWAKATACLHDACM